MSSAFRSIKKLALWALDLVGVFLSYFICMHLRFGANGFAALSPSEVHTHKVMVVILVIMVVILNLSDRRNKRGLMRRNTAQELLVVITYNFYLLVGIAVLALALRLEPIPPRSVILGTALLNIPIMLVLRCLAKALTRRVFGRDNAISNVLMIVDPGQRSELEHRFWVGSMYRIAGWLTISSDGTKLDGQYDGHPVSCQVFELQKALARYKVNDVYVGAHSMDEDAKSVLIEAVQSLGAVCHLSIQVPGSGVESAFLGYFGDLPVITYASKGSAFYRLFMKRVLDIIFSVIVTVLIIIPGAIICLIISLQSKGSPFYTQERLGLNGRHFRLLKFRSMVADADDVERYFTPEQLQEWHAEHKVENDPRITGVGRILRKTSLDELPQFLNVLKGDMSIVGPRPIVDEELQNFGPYAKEFLSCKPGITGWWQVEARNDADFASGRRQKLELYYVRHSSFKLDWEVVKRTVGAVFHGTGR